MANLFGTPTIAENSPTAAYIFIWGFTLGVMFVIGTVYAVVNI